MCKQDVSTDFTQRYLATPDSEGVAAFEAARNNIPSPLGSPTPSLHLREWARASLVCRQWKDALTAAIGVSIYLCADIPPAPHTFVGFEFTVPGFMVYRTLCERLETIDHVLDASECFLQMADELGLETTLKGEQAEWAAGERSCVPLHGSCDTFHVAFRERCTKKLEHLGDVAADTQQLDNAIVQYSAALSLDLLVPRIFIKRSKVYLAKGGWEDALHDANQVRLPYLAWVVLINAETLGNNPPFIFMGCEERVDRVVQSGFNE